jgi:hypothetical protein
MRRAPEQGVLCVAKRAFLVRQQSEAFVVEGDARPAGERSHHDARYLRRSVVPCIARRADVEPYLCEKLINEIVCHRGSPWRFDASMARRSFVLSRYP